MTSDDIIEEQRQQQAPSMPPSPAFTLVHSASTQRMPLPFDLSRRSSEATVFGTYDKPDELSKLDSPTDTDAIETVASLPYYRDNTVSGGVTRVNSREDLSVIYEKDKADDLEKGSIVDEKPTVSVTEQEKEQSTIPPHVNDEPPAHGRLLPLGRFLLVYAVLGLAVLMTALDSTIVATTLPNIGAQFGSDSLSWVGAAFLLTQTTFAPLYGKMSDVFGRKPLFLVAQVLAFIGCVIAATAPSMPVLILGRAIGGIGGSGLFTMVHICISDVVTLNKRGVYHGILSAVNGTGSAIGPLIGGLLVSIPPGWRLAFYVQLPIYFVAFIGTLVFLPQIGKNDRRLLNDKLKTLDYVGMVLFLGGFIVLLLGINFVQPPKVPFTEPKVIIPFIVGLLTCVAFFFWEAKGAKQPLISLKTFRNLSVDLVFVLNFSFGWLYYSSLFYLPELFRVSAGQSAVQAAVSLTPLVVSSIFFSWLTGLLASMWQRYKWSLLIAYTLQTIGAVLTYVYFRPGMSTGAQISILLVLGTAFGCSMQTSLLACQAAAKQSEVARTTSLRNFIRNSGGVLGLAVSGAIRHVNFPNELDRGLGAIVPDEILDAISDDPTSIGQNMLNFLEHQQKAVAAYSKAVEPVYLVWIPISAIALVACILLPEYKLKRGSDGIPQREEPLLKTILRKRKDTAQASATSA